MDIVKVRRIAETRLELNEWFQVKLFMVLLKVVLDRAKRRVFNHRRALIPLDQTGRDSEAILGPKTVGRCEKLLRF